MSRSLRQWLQLGCWAVFLFLGTLALHTRDNQFPVFYQASESGRAKQVLSGKWDMSQPMLLPSVTLLGVAVFEVPRTVQSVGETGRWVSAVFTGVAVVAFSLLAFLWRGWPGAWLAGGALALHHQLFELAHYMKEDSALLMGFSLSFLGAAWYGQNPSRGRAMFLGVACALAITGKYMGVLALAVALPVLWSAKNRSHWLVFAVALAAVFALVNLPLVADWANLSESWEREFGTNRAAPLPKGMTRSVPHAQYWSIFLDNSTPAVWLFLLIFWFARWREWRAIAPAEWAIILFAPVYGIILSFAARSGDANFLPVSAVVTVLAVLGIEDGAHLAAGVVKRVPLLIAGAVILLGLQITGWAPRREGLFQYAQAFKSDDFRDLMVWIRNELPPESVIIKDARVRLPDLEVPEQEATERSIPQKMWVGRSATDWGNLDELPAKGVTHLLVSESDYGKFFLGGVRPQKWDQPDFNRRKIFYERLFRECTLLWESERGPVLCLHPGLRLYRLPKG